MANPEKHKRNPLEEYLVGEDSLVPTQTRGRHVAGAYVKGSKKPDARKGRIVLPVSREASPDPLQFREAGAASVAPVKHSQASSWEHLRKKEKQKQLRPRPSR